MSDPKIARPALFPKSNSEPELVDPMPVGTVSSQRMTPGVGPDLKPLTKDDLTELLINGLKARLPKRTKRQRFWNFFRSIFQALANFCEKRQVPPEQKASNRVLATRLADILATNLSRRPPLGVGYLFQGIGDTTKPDRELDKKFGPPITMEDPADKNPSKIPSAVMRKKPMMVPNPDEAIHETMLNNVRKSRIRELLVKLDREDGVTEREQHELDGLLSESDEIIILE